MKDLVEESGFSRETIHYYIAEGLLPAGEKTSRTTAFYTREHLDRLRRIRSLREEQYLPVRAVKALLSDEPEGELTSRQRLFLKRADKAIAGLWGRTEDVPLASLSALGLDPRDLKTLDATGVIQIKRARGRRYVSPADAEILEAFASLREAGFTRERGYSGAELQLLDERVEALVATELGIASDRLRDQPVAVLEAIIERTNPYLEHLFLVMRNKKLRGLVRAGAVESADPTAGSGRRKKER